MEGREPCLTLDSIPPPPGAIHLEFKASGNHYVWRKSTSTVHNIIVGKLWIDQVTGSLWGAGVQIPNPEDQQLTLLSIPVVRGHRDCEP